MEKWRSIAALVGDTPGMDDVRKGFVSEGWDVLQAHRDVGGLRRQLVIHGSRSVVLVVSSHSSVADQYGPALLTLLGDRTSFEGVIATVVLLEGEPPADHAPASSVPPAPDAPRWTATDPPVRFGSFAAIDASHSITGPKGIEWPCDLRAFAPEDVIGQAIACGASGHPGGLRDVRERMLDRHRKGSVLGEIGSVDG